MLHDALDVLERTLRDTRTRPGCLGVDVMVDVGDPAHVIVVERWESLEHDDTYRDWRTSPETGAPARTAPRTWRGCWSPLRR